MAITTFKYLRTENLGDAVQSLAFFRLLPEHSLITRDKPEVSSVEGSFIGYGFLDDRWKTVEAEKHAYCGVHTSTDSTAQRLVQTPDVLLHPVGARDPISMEKIKSFGAASEFVGCATLTLDKYDGPRDQSIAVDFPEQVPIPRHFTQLTHKIQLDLSWEDQLIKAQEYLDTYKTAKEVWTSRLHVLLPCIAFGTPVRFFPKSGYWEDSRLSIARYLGVDKARGPEVFQDKGLSQVYQEYLTDLLVRLDEK